MTTDMKMNRVTSASSRITPGNKLLISSLGMAVGQVRNICAAAGRRLSKTCAAGRRNMRKQGYFQLARRVRRGRL
jgi:hypothetical protein